MVSKTPTQSGMIPLGHPNIPIVFSLPSLYPSAFHGGEGIWGNGTGETSSVSLVYLIYLNLGGLQSNQTAINSLFIRGLHVCLLHMDEPEGHTVPLKRELWKVRAQGALQTGASCPSTPSALSFPLSLARTPALWGKLERLRRLLPLPST